MKQKIKIALCVRVVVLLIGPGLYCLFANNFINKQYNDDTPTIDEFSSRQLLNVRDHDTRDAVESRINSVPLAPENHSITEDEVEMKMTRSVTATDLHLPTERIKRGFSKNVKIVFNVLASGYCFLMLAIICDEYFIGSIEILCQKLHVREDVAGTTFMAMATSSPELFINCVGTFVTEGDIGVGTIVGSAVFNVLIVPACCGLLTRTAIQLEWWSITRDCTFYGFSVIALIAVIYDNQIMWYEAAYLVAAYAIYLIFMHKNNKLSEKAKLLAQKVKRRIYRQPYHDVSEIAPLFIRVDIEKSDKKIAFEFSEPFVKLDESSNYSAANPWKISSDANTLMYFIKWPITFVLWSTIPDARRFKSFYILTFINCVLWIGCISYFVVNIATNVDSVMGLTFLAAGTSLPEAVSSVIVTAQGFGSMGISNSLGSNTFDILLCLGLPWLIKTLIAPTISGQPWITLKSTDSIYTAISLTTTLFVFYFALVVNKFKLDRRIGFVCLFSYILFLLFASLVEMNIFFHVTSDH